MRNLLLPFLLLCFSNTFSQVNLTSGLVAYYPFDGNANDVSGNGNHGIVSNATLAPDRFGNQNSAYSFDGTSSFIKVPNCTAFAFGNKITLAAYVKVQGFYGGLCHGNSIINKGDNDNVPGLTILRFDDGEYTRGQNCSNPNVDQAHQSFYGQGTFAPPGNPPYINLNQWYCVVYTYDGSTAKLYVDGELKSSQVAPGLTFTNPNDLFIGKTISATFPYYFHGILDEIRIYNRAINYSEVSALCNLCVPTQVNLTSGLVAYYPFDGNANDASGNGNHGIVSNATLSPDRFGNQNSAYSFDGTSSFIKVPNCTAFAFGNKITLAAYVKVQGFYGGLCHGNSIINKGDNDNVPGLTILRFDDGEYTRVQNCSNPNVDQAHQSFYGQGTFAPPGNPPYINLSQWYCVVYTYDGSTAKLYVDGELKSSQVAPGLTFTNPNDLFIGKTISATFPYYFHGILDEIRIYNRAISCSEVTALCNYSPPPVLLPVQITQFSAIALNNKDVKLIWTTEHEENISKYQIQKSESNNNFKSIGDIAAINTGDKHEYLFIDDHVQMNVNYQYRIMAIGNLGNTMFSEIRSVMLSNNNFSVNIYPNPSRGNIVIKLNGYTGKTQFTFTNSLGQTIINKVINVTANVPETFNLGNQTQGIYVVKIKTTNGISIQKINIE